MGGALMAEILNDAPQVVDRLQRIILQPNIGAETVRIWAEKNRWHIASLLPGCRQYFFVPLPEAAH